MTETVDLRLVSASVYNPANSIFKAQKSERATCTTVSCSLPECPLLANAQCVCRGGVFSANYCPYGDVKTVSGPTQRARSYSGWVAERRDETDGIPCLSAPPKKMAFIGDYVYLPYSHMTMCKSVPFLSHYSLAFSGKPFVQRDDWTVNVVETLVRFRPLSLTGHEIASYRKKDVPRFVSHLRECDSAMFAELVKRCPEFDTAPDYVGRKAILSTLKAPIEWTETSSNGKYPVTWRWDGVYAVTQSEHAYNDTWGGMKRGKVDIRLVPRERQAIVVRDNAWVTDETEFVD